jgi:glycogen/starch/alpha-glucan phosphorylase-like protein
MLNCTDFSKFGYTNHTVLPEALEKWSVPLFQNLLPRHLQIIYEINLYFLQAVERKFPKDRELLARVSIIEESQPKMVRMAFLAIVGSHKINGVAELHSDLIKTTIFKDFVKIFGPDKFTNVTNGITPRRWLHQANPRLSELIASKTGGLGFLKDLNILNDLEKYADDKEFKKEWAEIKYANKVRLAKHIKTTTGVTVNPSALFDIQVKRIHEYKRQQMNIFGVIHRYLNIKAMTPEERKKLAPRVSIFGGKAAPGYWMAKTIIHLINNVGSVINKDPDVGDLLKVIFLEDYNVSKAEIIIPASDISEHISTAGTEASGTSNMKFVLNGGLIIGTCDGANVSIYSSCLLWVSNLSRLKSPEKLARTISSSLAIWPRTLKISATHTPTARTTLMPISPRSSRKSRRVLSVMRGLSLLSSVPSKNMVITTLSRTTLTAITKRRPWSTRLIRIKMSGSLSVLPAWHAWGSLAVIGVLMSTRRASGMWSL